MNCKLGDPCRFCLRPITQDVIDLKRKLKGDNARESLRKAALNGSKIGRKRVNDVAKVREMRETGLTIREIAAVMGTSHPSVYRTLKLFKIKKGWRKTNPSRQE